jgi:hypothetical protein
MANMLYVIVLYIWAAPATRVKLGGGKWKQCGRKEGRKQKEIFYIGLMADRTV